MHKKIKLLLTFDYELPLGGCLSYNKGLFEPSERLLELAKDKNIPIVLFADILSVKMFKQWNNDLYVKSFKNQISKAIKQGHDIQLHIHPHWTVSKYKNEQFVPVRKFKLGDFKDFEGDGNIEAIISESIDLMYELCLETNPDYKCIAYRGGGYNLRPETDRIFKALYDKGIRIDSTIVKGLYSKSDLRNEDYRNMPNLSNWFIDLEGNLGKTSKNGMLEIPVTTMPVFPNYRVERMYKKIKSKKLYKKLAYNHTGKGFAFHTDNFMDKLKNAYFAPLVLSFDNLTTNIKNLEGILNYSLKKYKHEDEIILCANSHPKAFGEHQYKLMSDFIDVVQRKYNNVIQFTTYREIYDERNLR
jgi:hypothetical protein